MKKVVSIIFSLLLICSFFTVSADTFVPSVGFKHDIQFEQPEEQYDEEGRLVIVTDYSSNISYIADDGCSIEIVLTPFAYRNTIAKEQSRNEIEIAMETIQNAKSVTDLLPVLGEKVDSKDLVVSNLFDITVYETHVDDHDSSTYHGNLYNIKLTSATLKNFEALMHYDADNNVWELVEDAKVTGEEKDTLTFTYDNASPFAIVTRQVDEATGEPIAPSSHVCCILHFNGHCYCIWLLILLIISLLLNVIQLFAKNRKKDEEQQQ